MTYKEFVSRPKAMRRRVEHQIEDVQLKWTICQGTTVALGDKVQTSPSNTTEANNLRYIESKKKLDKYVEKLDAASHELRTFLYSHLDLDMADILEWKYIDCKTIQEMADIKGLEYDSMKNKIHKADRIAKKIYDELPNVTKCY